jgi:hypothetical protein
MAVLSLMGFLKLSQSDGVLNVSVVLEYKVKRRGQPPCFSVKILHIAQECAALDSLFINNSVA